MTAAAPKQILVVDNNPVLLKMIADHLQKQGHFVACAKDAFDCLDTIVEMKPDIIFLDLIMPQIGGDDLCRMIRIIDSLKNCYIAIISAVALEQDVDFRKLGANACIAKGPFSEMRKHIQAAIEDSENPREDLDFCQIQGIEGLFSRQITRELLEQNDHLKIILEGVSQGIIELERERIAYLNPKAIDILGGSREQFLGQHIERTLPRTLLDVIQNFNSGTDLLAEPICSLPIHIAERQLVVEQLPIKGEPDNRIVLLSDVTDRKKMEAVIEATNLSQNIGYIFSGIRHEIGNPVNSIKMALSVLKRNLAEYDEHTVSEFLDRSLVEITRIEYLLKALKNYSLFETPDMQNVSVSEFISGFIPLIKDDFENNQIHIQSLISDSALTVWTDPRALHHIMLNLLTNAADALEGCDHPQINISVTNRGKRLHIKVDDNGKGMSDADQKNLFKPFMTSKPGGTGLGLVIVEKMLSALDGNISFESYQGVGTTVTVSLPQEKNGTSLIENTPDY